MPHIKEVKLSQCHSSLKKINLENEEMIMLAHNKLHHFDLCKFTRNLRLSQTSSLPWSFMKPVISYPSFLKKNIYN